ncbi:MAG: DUF4097 domain-containing protein [Firmicutes bacterium]|nr:DUF4097 domain-containing protein [Bacillota bacterium]
MSFRQIFLPILVGLTILMVLSVSGGVRDGDLVDIGSFEKFIWSSPSGLTEYLERCPNSDRSGKSSVPAGGLSQFTLVGSFGDISIKGSDGDRIEIDHTITVFADTSEQAAEYLSQCHISEELRDDRLDVILTEPADRPAHIRGVFANYEILIPHGLSVDVSNQVGEVSITDYQGGVALENGFMPTTVRNVTGTLTVNARHGPLSVENLTGSADISVGFAKVNVTGIEGNAKISVEHCDSAVVGGVTGSVDIKNQFSNLRISDIGGFVNLDSRHGSVTASGISGPIDISAEFCDVELSRVTETVDVTASHGQVSIGLVKDPSATGGYSIRTQVSSGKTISDVPLDETEIARGTRRATGVYGSGAIPVTVCNEYGNIRLRLVN